MSLEDTIQLTHYFKNWQKNKAFMQPFLYELFFKVTKQSEVKFLFVECLSNK